MLTSAGASNRCSSSSSEKVELHNNRPSHLSPHERHLDTDGSSLVSSDLELGAKLTLKEPSAHGSSCIDDLTDDCSNGEQLADNNATPRNSGSLPTCSGALAPDRANSKAALHRSKTSIGKGVKQRFVQDPGIQGGHEHFLESSRRRDKLSNLWRGLFRQKRVARPQDELSLVPDWVATVRQETKAASSTCGQNDTANLVEKYGKCQEVLGRGAFGVVRVSHKNLDSGRQKLFAVKEFHRNPKETEREYNKRLTAEFCISSSLRHPNIIHTLDLLRNSDDNYCEIMEFCAGGDVTALVLASGELEVQEADCFFKQMMRGVEYLHEMGVAHRDLKPDNLLLTNRGALKISDFGNGECFRMAWESEVRFVSGMCGSMPYISPEEHTEREFDARATDVWACGVIYMAMRTGRHLWRVANADADELYARYLEGRRDEDGYGLIESLHRVQCRNVIYSVLDPNPTRRITATQVLKSEWVRTIQLCKAGEEGL